MKYIDAEKLIAKIEELDDEYRTLRINGTTQEAKEADLVVHVLHGISNFIDSLQQEQPKVDLNEEIERFIDAHYHTRFDETLENGNDPLTVFDFQDIARHFYELGKNSK